MEEVPIGEGTITSRKASLGLKALSVAVLAFLAVVASTSVPWDSVALAQTAGICDRTQEVRDAILTKLSDVSDCANVTDTHLGGITGDLTLSDKK